MPTAAHALDSRDFRSEGAMPADFADSWWPSDLLNSFTLLMAADGHCVSTSMMLGDRDYALEQLAHAHTSVDDGLRALAVRMFSFFDRPPAVALHA